MGIRGGVIRVETWDKGRVIEAARAGLYAPHVLARLAKVKPMEVYHWLDPDWQPTQWTCSHCHRNGTASRKARAAGEVRCKHCGTSWKAGLRFK